MMIDPVAVSDESGDDDQLCALVAAVSAAARYEGLSRWPGAGAASPESVIIPGQHIRIAADVIDQTRPFADSTTSRTGAGTAADRARGRQERSGALIVAEGIETEAHLAQARAVGATLGQGNRFGALTCQGSLKIDPLWVL